MTSSSDPITALQRLFEIMDRLAEAERQRRKEQQDNAVSALRKAGRLWWADKDDDQPEQP